MNGLKQAGAVLSQADQEIQEMLTPLVQALTDPDEAGRQDSVRRLLPVCPPSVLGRVIDRLVELLGGRNEAACRRAGASLAEMGPPALPALTLALTNRRRRVGQRAAAEALTAMAPGLVQRQLLDLGYSAMTAMWNAADVTVGVDLLRLMSAVRKALESGPCSVTPEGPSRDGPNMLASSDAAPGPDAPARSHGRKAKRNHARRPLGGNDL